jgi:hypothetical protein
LQIIRCGDQVASDGFRSICGTGSSSNPTIKMGRHVDLIQRRDDWEMYRFVDWFEPNRRLAQILKILVLVTGALALIVQLPA